MKHYVLILLASLCLSVTGFSEVRIGFLLSSMKEERYKYDKMYFIEMARDRGFAPLFKSANNDGERQWQQARELIESGIAVLILQPHSTSAGRRIVDLAKRKNIPVISYDRKTEATGVVAYITHNNAAIGQIQAEHLIKSGRNWQKIIICAGERNQSVTQEITKSLSRGLTDKTVAPDTFYHTDCSEIRCHATVLKNLKPSLKSAVLANNSKMAQGAIDAIKKLNMTGETFIAGADGSTQSCRNIKAGLQHLDVHKPIKKMMTSTFAYIDKIMAKTLRPSQKTETVIVPVEAIHSGNLKDFFHLDSCKKIQW
ncbi:MAG: substrate-binding domain-containing protein [Pseudobacteriovorax sp.]|nr:substrate-binding domain-containing protein [Pseudobacteriovorax sp.]